MNPWFGLLLAGALAPTVEPAVLAGDFVEPEAVAVVFTDTWADTWRAIVEATPRRVKVVVAREDRTPAAVFDEAVAALDRRVRRRVVRLPEPVDTPWVRDWGPLQLLGRGKPQWLDNRYTPLRPQDDAGPAGIARALGQTVEQYPIAIEGGAVASNGAGLCVMTREFREEHALRIDFDPADLGCASLVLVPALFEEPTDHVDLFLQFVAPDRVVIAAADAETDPENARRLAKTRREVTKVAAELGVTLEIVDVPLPPRDDAKQYLSYAGFVRVGDAVLVAEFSGVEPELQASAHAALRRAMPDLSPVPVPADELAAYHGSLHCIVLGLHLPGRR